MPQTIHRGIKSLIDEANAQIETVSAADAIKAAQSDDVVIVDIRDPREIERDGRIPGAFSCTRGMLEFWIDPASPYAKPIFQSDKKFIFHCAGGMRSALAAKTEFKHLEYFYFHNCLYEGVWKQNRRRFTDRTPTWDVLHKYPHDYKVVFVGDASMSPYEIMVPGGSVEHVNEEAGSVWLERITRTYPHAVWLNPVAQRHWDYSESTTLIRRLFSERMFPITIEGLEGAMKELVR